MQAAFLLLCQYLLLHLQVHLLLAEKDQAFLQHPVEVSELSGFGARDTRLGEVVLLNNLGSDMTGVTFHMHHSKAVLKSCQSILPCGDGTIPAIQLPLPGKDQPLLLNDHRI
jgi:hypothetical protein